MQKTQKLPTFLQVEKKYQHLCGHGKGMHDLTTIEQIIIGAPCFNKAQESLFRSRLLVVLKEGLIEPETDMEFKRFVQEYPPTNEGKIMLGILLSDAIIEFRRSNGYPKRSYN